VNPPAAEDFPPLAPVCSFVLPPDPFEASEETRGRDVHALLDQIELPCFQESQEAWEEEEELEAGEEAPSQASRAASGQAAPAPLSRLDELRRELATLSEQANEAYLLRLRSTYGTWEYEERSRRMQTLRENQQRVRTLLYWLEEG
jgi:hypothetical protein